MPGISVPFPAWTVDNLDKIYLHIVQIARAALRIKLWNLVEADTGHP